MSATAYYHQDDTLQLGSYLARELSQISFHYRYLTESLNEMMEAHDAVPADQADIRQRYRTNAHHVADEMVRNNVQAASELFPKILNGIHHKYTEPDDIVAAIDDTTDEEFEHDQKIAEDIWLAKDALENLAGKQPKAIAEIATIADVRAWQTYVWQLSNTIKPLEVHLSEWRQRQGAAEGYIESGLPDEINDSLTHVLASVPKIVKDSKDLLSERIVDLLTDPKTRYTDDQLVEEGRVELDRVRKESLNIIRNAVNHFYSVTHGPAYVYLPLDPDSVPPTAEETAGLPLVHFREALAAIEEKNKPLEKETAEMIGAVALDIVENFTQIEEPDDMKLTFWRRQFEKLASTVAPLENMARIRQQLMPVLDIEEPFLSTHEISEISLQRVAIAPRPSLGSAFHLNEATEIVEAINGARKPGGESSVCYN